MLKGRIVLVILCLISTCACSVFDFDIGGDPADFTLQDAESFIGTPLPKGAINVQYMTEAGIDRILLIGFSAPADELDAFVQALGFTETTGSNAPVTSEPGIRIAPAWWRASVLPSTLSWNELINNKSYTLVIEDSGEAMPEVYLQVFSM